MSKVRNDNGADRRVLVLAPTGRDATAIAEVTKRAKLAAHVCRDLDEMVLCLREGAGATFIAEEALRLDRINRLQAWIEAQPRWSDLPFVILSSRQDEAHVRSWREHLVSMLRNVTLLERPVQALTLLSALTAALRSRQHQYEIRDHLAERERAAEHLENLVHARTEDLRHANQLLQEQMAERERISEQLRHAQKLEAVGQLTGGIAHDFNNLLMVISGGLNMLERRPERRTGVIEAMKKAAARGAGLTHQLLAFSRRQALSPEPVDLKSYFHELAVLLDRSLRGDVEVVTEIAADAWPVMADPNELQLAIMNLAVNARDAMPAGGHIVIRGANRPADEADPAAKDMVCISVTDQGTGMTPEVLDKVFEPFFTTKEVGKGSGLGLAQVHGYATQSGGLVEIASVVGCGTTVSLCLPRSTEMPAANSPKRMESRGEVHSRRGHILVVEDDEEVAALVSGMLRELNYQVTRAPMAAAALDVLRDEPIDIVFSDVMMPGEMDGLQLSREIRRLYPEVQVLLTSGYPDAIRRTTNLTGVDILPKPYQLEELGAALERVRNGSMSSSTLH